MHTLSPCVVSITVVSVRGDIRQWFNVLYLSPISMTAEALGEFEEDILLLGGRAV